MSAARAEDLGIAPQLSLIKPPSDLQIGTLVATLPATPSITGSVQLGLLPGLWFGSMCLAQRDGVCRKGWGSGDGSWLSLIKAYK